MATLVDTPSACLHEKNSQEFVKSLALWFKNHGRSLPWRANRTVYETWVSEVMSQQTTLAVVVPRFLEFIHTLSHVDHLAQAPEEVLRVLWAGLGYYSRARNLQKAAQAICAQGAFPSHYKGWLALPGVGPYTAAMISSLCFQEPVAAVDGNVMRVVCRLTANSSPQVWTPKGQGALAAFVQALLPHAHSLAIGPGVVNEALIELGATVCRKHNPQCGLCPVQSHCLAFQQQVVHQCPMKKPRMDAVEVSLDINIHYSLEKKAVALVERKGPWLSKTVGFPVESTQNRPLSQDALPTNPQIPFVLGDFRHTITRHRIQAHVLANLHSPQNDPYHWVSWDEVSKRVSSSLDKKAWQFFSQHVKNNPQIGRLN